MQTSGDLILFVDDYIWPEAYFISHLVAEFQDDSVVGVGGVLIDQRNARTSAACTMNRLGEEICDTPLGRGYPLASTAPRLPFNACMFRRSALEPEGFDEGFAGPAAVADICFRLMDRGGRLVLADKAVGYVRQDDGRIREPLQSENPVGDNLRLGLRHALAHHGLARVLHNATQTVSACPRSMETGSEAPWAPDTRKSDAALSQYLQVRPSTPTKLPRRLDSSDIIGSPLEMSCPPNDRRSIVIIDDTKLKLSPGLPTPFEIAATGQKVHLIVKSEGQAGVKFSDGVWIHELAPAETAGSPAAGHETPDKEAQMLLHELQLIGDQEDVAAVDLRGWPEAASALSRLGTLPVVVAAGLPGLIHRKETATHNDAGRWDRVVQIDSWIAIRDEDAPWPDEVAHPGPDQGIIELSADGPVAEYMVALQSRARIPIDPSLYRISGARKRVPILLPWEAGLSALFLLDGARLVFIPRQDVIYVSFFKHGWSGIAQIRCNDVVIREVDLYASNDNAVVVKLDVSVGLPVEIAAFNALHPLSQGNEVGVIGIYERAHQASDGPR